MRCVEKKVHSHETVSRFKPLAEMNGEERRMMERVCTILQGPDPRQDTVQDAAFFFANHYWLHEGLFVPQMHDYDCYLAQKYAINNTLPCILFTIHESHSLLAFLKKKKQLEQLKKYFFRVIEKKLTRWTNVYISIRDKQESALCTQLDILRQMCILKLCRILVREKKYWIRLLDEVQARFSCEGREISVPEIPDSELRHFPASFSSANEFLLDLRKQCIDATRTPPGTQMSFVHVRSAFQLKWIVGKWTSLPLLTDIVWLYQDLFNEKLWYTFRETTLCSYHNLKSAIDAYRKNVQALCTKALKEPRGRYYMITQQWLLRAIEEKEEPDALTKEYLGILATYVGADKTAPSPFTSLTWGPKQKGCAMRFTNPDHIPVVKAKRTLWYYTLVDGECICPCLFSAGFSTGLSWYIRSVPLWAELATGRGDGYFRGKMTVFPDLMEGKNPLWAGVFLHLIVLVLFLLFRHNHKSQCMGEIVVRHIF
ncbi:hypothetical protein NEPAR04_1739 [Nematocida parisii]|nr:hypothetical protein NEPAR08_1010 [Nematocida parisii]KAI5130039.1 hypothetical protein NEPAR08_1830 [Nematocida parisii]KAI5130752.1 hypothetical protein NEPAR03_2197 [Nematocida parisii]KAI5141271.1 hypothetical protein NEPAR04_0841 [Nematocida parisii]KAI5143074.1 hypothetical protein NEPAR04_1739 [Nematocida parisii]